MKTKKQTGKKVLSVFLAVLMIMTAWVFVAPEKAEAATAGRYYIKYVVNVTDTGNEKDNNFQISYKTNNGQGTQVTDEMLQDADRYGWSGNDVVVWEGYIDGFPTQTWHHYAFNMNTRTERHENIRLFVGKDANNLSSSSVLATSGNNWTYRNANQDCRMDVVSGFPYQNSITGMSALTVSVNANGTGQSTTTTGVVYDQYGVSWYQAPTYTVSSSSTSQVDVSGISAVTSGDGAYVKVTDPAGVFKEDYGYNSSTGQVTLYLRATSGSAVASVPITITAPKFTATWQNGTTTIKTNTWYYDATPSYSGDNPVKGSDVNNKYTFSHWSPTPGPIKADTTYTAQYIETPHTWPAEPKEEHRVDATCSTEGSRELVKYCTVCGKELERVTQKLEKLQHTFTEEVVHDDYLISAATCNASAKYYKSCKDCGASSKSNSYTFEYGDFDFSTHKISEVEGKASTCYSEGIKDHYECSVCHRKFSDASGNTEVRYDDLVIGVISHTDDMKIDAIAPSCVAYGYTEGTRCSVCKAIVKVPEQIPMLHHEDNDHDHICDNGCGDELSEHVDNDKNHYCDFEKCNEELSWCEDDINQDHKCDYCGKYDDKTFGPHEDADPVDHICDYCGEIDYDKFGRHEDLNKDHKCDNGCEVEFDICEDVDPVDHKCDYGCGKEYGKHEDKDNDHDCDYGCAEKIGTCEDADKDHDCDYGCDKVYGDHVDTNLDHKCDYGCAEEFGTCEDTNLDHKCDYGCDKPYGDHADVENDGNHDCEYCGKKASECTKGEEVKENFVDSTCETEGSYNSVFYCTECGEEVDRTNDIKIEKKPHVWSVSYEWAEDGSTCTAIHSCASETPHQETEEVTTTSEVVRDPACGVRGVTEYTATFEADWATEQVITLADISPECPDANMNHWCDDHEPEEGQEGDFNHYKGVHEDKNKDHKCDYGCSEAIGECVDNDKDHYCDHGCGKYYGTHADADKDHNCDYGCAEKIGTHADKENDGDHLCEYCNKEIGECTPGEEKIENKTEPTCDKEGSYDSVHYCTECGKEVSRVEKTIEKLPHDWNETVYLWDADAKTFTATRTCQNFASHVETETVAAIEEILVAPKCETLESPTGSAKYTSAFTVDWATEQTEEVVLPALPHKDDNKDHKCDSGCNITFGVCEDKDHDHKCDYGCDKFYGKHEDLTGAENRPDHFCDYCNERISNCVDEDFDHNCDFDCGASYGTCEDKNHDHHCDYGVNCPVVFGECKDEDKDHKCDYGEGCKVVFGAHKWNGHSDIDEIKSKATCMSPAIYYNYCSYCNKPVDDATHEYGEADTVNGHKFDGRVTATENDNHSVKCTVAGCSESKLVDCRYETTKEVLATCQTNGYKVEKCLICRDSKKTNTEKNPANHVGGTEIKDAVDATCIADGYSGDTYCLGCKAKIADGKVVTADPAVHAHVNMKDYDKVDSTCEKEGYEAYRYCDACKTYAVEKVVIAKKDHQYTNYVSNGDGTHSAQCETCSAVQNTIACSGGVANCVDKKVCDFCKEPYGEKDSTNHKKTITVAKKDATCQVEGNNPYLKCEACNTALEDIITIEKKAHVYGEWTKVAGKDKHVKSCLTCNADIADVATVEEDCEGGFAYCNKLAKCSVCKGDYGSFDYSHHRSEITTLVDAKAATCCEKGYTGDEYYICCYDESKTADENAGALKKSGTEIPVAEHNFTIEIVSERVPANCKETGNATYKCSTCPEGKEATKVKTLEIDLSNHKSSTTITVGEVEATCIEDGFTGNVYYDCCYDSTKTDAENKIALKTKGTVVKANGEHNYGGIYPEYSVEKIEETKDADGNVTSREIVLKNDAVSYDDMVAARHADGFWYHVKVCTVCYEVSRERCYTYTSDKATCTTTEKCEVCEGLCSLMDSSNHAAAELVEGKSATCTENGVKDYYKCTACGKRFFDASCTKEITTENEDELIIVANGTHTIDRKNQKPTANYNGTHTYKCSACGTEEITESCSGGTATCSTLKTCQYCGVSYGEFNDKVHEKGTIEIGRVEPDRCKPGVKGKVQYECCGKVTSGGEEIPALEDHTWTETTSKTDNCASGYTITRTCDVCKTVETEEVAAGTHKLSVIVYESEKDCTTTRYIYYACSICSHTEHEVVINGTTYKYISVEEIPAKDDCSWSAWTTVKASCIAEGSKSRHCLVCGKTENIVLPKTAHSVVVEGGYGATCDTAGKQDYAYCAVTGCPYAKGGQPIGTVPGYEKYANSNGQVIGALGHGDHNGDDYCDHCGRYEDTNVDGTNCNCICHKQNGFMKLIYKFLQFFWKLFKINKTCCSAGVHY